MNPRPYSKREPIGCGVLLAIALLAPVGYVGLVLYSWRDTTPRGPLASTQEWPEPIRELHDAMKVQVQVPAFEVYLLYGRGIDSTAMCRVDDAPGVFEFLQATLQLKAVPSDAGRSDLFFNDLLPNDWRPTSRAGSQFFVSQHWLDGGEGPLYALARDPQTRRLFLYYYFNF
ncbi:MAG: hypothetical protein U0836_22400 [Pirellulales bacterium]